MANARDILDLAGDYAERNVSILSDGFDEYDEYDEYDEVGTYAREEEGEEGGGGKSPFSHAVDFEQLLIASKENQKKAAAEKKEGEKVEKGSKGGAEEEEKTKEETEQRVSVLAAHKQMMDFVDLLKGEMEKRSLDASSHVVLVSAGRPLRVGVWVGGRRVSAPNAGEGKKKDEKTKPGAPHSSSPWLPLMMVSLSFPVKQPLMGSVCGGMDGHDIALRVVGATDLGKVLEEEIQSRVSCMFEYLEDLGVSAAIAEAVRLCESTLIDIFEDRPSLFASSSTAFSHFERSFYGLEKGVSLTSKKDDCSMHVSLAADGVMRDYLRGERKRPPYEFMWRVAAGVLPGLIGSFPPVDGREGALEAKGAEETAKNDDEDMTSYCDVCYAECNWNELYAEGTHEDITRMCGPCMQMYVISELSNAGAASVAFATPTCKGRAPRFPQHDLGPGYPTRLSDATLFACVDGEELRRVIRLRMLELVANDFRFYTQCYNCHAQIKSIGAEKEKEESITSCPFCSVQLCENGCGRKPHAPLFCNEVNSFMSLFPAVAAKLLQEPAKEREVLREPAATATSLSAEEPLSSSFEAASDLKVDDHVTADEDSSTLRDIQRAISAAVGAELAKNRNLGEEVKSVTGKKCPSCRKFIEKNGGCQHMTCHCGTQFCWVCGREWGRLHDWSKCHLRAMQEITVVVRSVEMSAREAFFAVRQVGSLIEKVEMEIQRCDDGDDKDKALKVLEEFTASNAIVLLRLKTTTSLARAEQIEEVYKAFARHFQSVADLFFREQASARARNTTRTTRRRQAGFLRSLEAMATTESKERDERRGAVWNLVARLESVVHSLQRELSAARRPSSSIGV
mmetsp:Transcript_26097/g.66256  ORF Transcript_26097/g.66256 Transcript_26097/m.66256 type:complete len:850 (-) Transcript_26097:195-2744(-)